eukprot:31176-Pelagococcus_subviridis.AAC.42
MKNSEVAESRQTQRLPAAPFLGKTKLVTHKRVRPSARPPLLSSARAPARRALDAGVPTGLLESATATRWTGASRASGVLGGERCRGAASRENREIVSPENEKDEPDVERDVIAPGKGRRHLARARAARRTRGGWVVRDGVVVRRDRARPSPRERRRGRDRRRGREGGDLERDEVTRRRHDVFRVHRRGRRRVEQHRRRRERLRRAAPGRLRGGAVRPEQNRSEGVRERRGRRRVRREDRIGGRGEVVQERVRGRGGGVQVSVLREPRVYDPGVLAEHGSSPGGDVRVAVRRIRARGVIGDVREVGARDAGAVPRRE